MNTETVRRYDPRMREWITVKVEVTPEPRRRARTAKTRTRRHGAPRDMAGLSTDAPLDPSWRDTAYAPGEPLADMRRHITGPAMKTHRAPVPAFTADGTHDGTRWFDL